MRLCAALPLFMLLAGPAQPAKQAWVLDDFESAEHMKAHALSWIALGDDQMGGDSTLTLETVAGGANGSGHALRLRGSVGAQPNAFTGAWAPLDGQGRPVDLGAFEALRFSARGEGTFEAGLRSGPGMRVANFMASFTPGPEWKTVEIPFDRLAPVGPGSQGAHWETPQVHWLGITPASNAHGPFDLQIDDVALVPRGGENAAPVASPGPPRTVRVSLVPAPASAGWRELAKDPAGDGKKASLPDAVSVSVMTEKDGGRVWFRIGLKEAPSQPWFGLNLVLDVDGDANNGAPWWGTNKAFHFDRLVSVWLFKTGSTYEGVAGTTNATALTDGEFMADGQDVRVAVDRDSPAFLVGVPPSVLGTGRGPVRLVAAVGSALAHNDDVPDTGAIALPR